MHNQGDFALQILGFQLLVERLVELGYPEQLKEFEYDPSFPVRYNLAKKKKKRDVGTSGLPLTKCC